MKWLWHDWKMKQTPLKKKEQKKTHETNNTFAAYSWQTYKSSKRKAVFNTLWLMTMIMQQMCPRVCRSQFSFIFRTWSKMQANRPWHRLYCKKYVQLLDDYIIIYTNEKIHCNLFNFIFEKKKMLRMNNTRRLLVHRSKSNITEWK